MKALRFVLALVALVATTACSGDLTGPGTPTEAEAPPPPPPVIGSPG